MPNNHFSIHPEAAKACIEAIEATRQALIITAQQWTHCPALCELGATMGEQIRKTKCELSLVLNHALQDAAQEATAGMETSAVAPKALPFFQQRHKPDDESVHWPTFIPLSE